MKKLLYFIIILSVLSCKDKNDYFQKVSANDSKLSAPMPGEWLETNHEKGQSFDEFLDSKHIEPTSEKKIIYLKPIGSFTSLQQKQLNLVNEYLSIFFQLKVKNLGDSPNSIIPSTARRVGYGGNEQLLASYILDSILKKQKPKDAIALMAVSQMDLYPKPDWNYVFGLSSYNSQVGITSIYRLEETDLKPENFDLCLTRLIKISSHEIGHMFGLHHCIEANCLMNGTNNLFETDKNPSRLCSHCQKKLNHSLKYSNKKRLVELIAFFKRNNLNAEMIPLQKDLNVISQSSS